MSLARKACIRLTEHKTGGNESVFVVKLVTVNTNALCVKHNIRIMIIIIIVIIIVIILLVCVVSGTVVLNEPCVLMEVGRSDCLMPLSRDTPCPK